MNTKVDKMLDSQDMVVIAEYRLLNAIFLNPDNLYKSGVDRNLFVHEVCKSLFDSIQHLVADKVPVTEQAVFQYGSGIDINISLKNIHEIATLQGDKNVEVKDMVETLDGVKKSLEAMNKMREVEALIHNNPVKNEEVEGKIRQLMFEAENLILQKAGFKKLENFDELSKDYIEIIDSRKNGKKYKFNDPLLDKIVTYGPAPGCGGLISAATGMGKSAYCLNLINRFINMDIPTIYYSLEMGKADTMDRLCALRTGIPLDAIINPATPDDWAAMKEKVEKELNTLKEHKNFRFSENASITLNQIKSDIIKFQQDIGQQYVVVFIDLLSMVKEFMITDKDGVNFAQGIEVAINVLNAMAKELGIHYVAVLQMNRKAEDGRIDDLKDIEKFKPTRSGIKNSGAFLERCRYALSLFRPLYYAQTYLEDESLYEDMQDKCYVSLLKQNQGKTGMHAVYLFDPEIMLMTPLTDSELEEGND